MTLMARQGWQETLNTDPSLPTIAGVDLLVVDKICGRPRLLEELLCEHTILDHRWSDFCEKDLDRRKF